jgi:tight adherence protein B
MSARRARRAPDRVADALAVEAVAAVVQRLGVMLGAGVAPANAWLHLRDVRTEPLAASAARADRPPGAPRPVRPDVRARARGEATARTARVVARVADAIEARASIPEAIEAAVNDERGADGTAGAWRALAAAWLVASESGAPLAATLAETADTLRQLGQLHRDVDAALAGPRSTARFVGIMPVVGLGFGGLLGFDTLGVLFGTVPGLICLGTGAGLSVLAARWTGILVARARPTRLSPGLMAQLVAIGLAGGGSIGRARALALAAQQRCGLDLSDDLESVDEVLALSRRAGVPAADLLRSESQQARREAATEAQAKAASLGTTLMMPLGACVLPAFMLLGVAPMMISIFSSTVTGLS